MVVVKLYCVVDDITATGVSGSQSKAGNQGKAVPANGREIWEDAEGR